MFLTVLDILRVEEPGLGSWASIPLCEEKRKMAAAH